jgi:hypothetical protein
MISMDLAIINLFPWPALDGWHLATMMLEGVRGRPMGERAQGELVKWGFITLLALMALIMFNDVTALVQGKLDFKLKGDQTTDKDKDKAKSSKDGTTPGDSAKTDSPTTTATDSSTSTSSSGTNSTSDSSSTSSQSKTEETVPSK